MPCINDYSTLYCLKKKQFSHKKNYPPLFDNFFNNLKHYKISINLSFPHFPQIFLHNPTFNYPHTCENCLKTKKYIKYKCFN